MKMRIRRNPRKNYTETQKADLRRANLMTVRARIFELGASKILEDDCGLDADATLVIADILASAASFRRDSEEIYSQIRREAAAAEHLDEAEIELPA